MRFLLYLLKIFLKNCLEKKGNKNYLEKYLRKAALQYGKENIIIKPDCGFLPLRDSFGEKAGYEIATRKIKNME